MLLLSLLFAVGCWSINPNTPDPNAVNVKCTSTKGNFSLTINPSWAPYGAARFLDMVDSGFFDRIAAYRVVPGFLVGFGVPFTNTKNWPIIPDDPNVGIQTPTFKRGMLAFAGYAENTRSTEAFISYADTPYLGKSAWGNPFGIVTAGMENLDKFYSGYGDLTQFGGKAPDPNRIHSEGGAFLLKEFPKLDYITACGRVGGAPKKAAAAPAPAFPASHEGLPSCAANYCGSGISRPSEPAKAVCLCHQVCMEMDPRPCCPGFQQACPAEYAKVLAWQQAQPKPKPAAPTPKAVAPAAPAAAKAKAGKKKM